MAVSKLKIVVSGPVRSGKTTLAQRLSQELSLPLISADLGPIYTAGSDFARSVTNSDIKPEQRKESFKNWVVSFLEWLKARDAVYEGLDGYVADTWEADLLVLWISRMGSHQVDRVTNALIEKIRERSSTLDAQVVLPWSFKEEVSSTGQKRQEPATLAGELRQIFLLQGTLRNFSKPKMTINVPLKRADIDNRFEFIKEKLKI